MKIVTASMKNKKVKLEEVEFDGTIAGLCKLLELTQYIPSRFYEDHPVLSIPSDLMISQNYSFIMSDEYILPGSSYKINGRTHNEGYVVAFVGIENIVENKSPLTLEYLESTIQYPTVDNPEME